MGYIKQRKKRGNYHAYWTGVDGERKRKSTSTNDPVAARERLREHERNDSIWRPPGFTVAQACEYAGKVQLDKENTEVWRQRCADAVIKHLFPLLGKDTDLNEVNIPKLVSDYIDKRREHKGPGGKPISKATIRKELLILRQGCEQAQIYGEFFGNLKQFIPKHLSKKGPQRDVRLTLEQANKLIEVATPHRRPWLVFGIHTGVDLGALHRIRPENIDTERGRHGVIYIHDTKNEHRPRTLPLTREARWAIDVRLERMEDGDEFVFSPPWTSQQIRVSMERWCKQIEVERIRFKDLRRTVASFAGEGGASELVLGKFLGHSGSSDMLRKVYLHVDDNALASVAESLPRLAVPDLCQGAPVAPRESQHNSGNTETEQIKNSLQITG